MPFKANNAPFFVRNAVYGLQDSLISTGGVILGMHAGGMHRSTIFRVGVLVVLAEALSMAYGAFIAERAFVLSANAASPSSISEQTSKKIGEIETKSGHLSLQTTELLQYAIVMFVAYIIAGTLVLLPFTSTYPFPTFAGWHTLGIIGVSLFAIFQYSQMTWIQTASLLVVAAGLLAISIYTGNATGA